MNILNRRWFQVFIGGLVLFYVLERTLLATGDLVFVPSVLLLGAYLVPVVFVIYLDEQVELGGAANAFGHLLRVGRRTRHVCGGNLGI